MAPVPVEEVPELSVDPVVPPVPPLEVPAVLPELLPVELVLPNPLDPDEEEEPKPLDPEVEEPNPLLPEEPNELPLDEPNAELEPAAPAPAAPGDAIPDADPNPGARPVSGWPKNPFTVVFASPTWIKRQSDLPVKGSTYSCRKYFTGVPLASASIVPG